MRKRRRRTFAPNISALSIRDPNRLDLLSEFGYLSAAQVAALRSLHIPTCTALAERAIDQGGSLADWLGIEQDAMLRASIAARLLNFSGPGSIMLRQVVVENAVAAFVESSDEPMALLTDEQDAIVRKVSQLFFQVTTESGPPKWRKEARRLPWLALSLALLGVGQALEHRSALFGHAGPDNPLQQMAHALVHANAITSLLALVGGGCAIGLVLWTVPLLVGAAVYPLLNRLSHRDLTSADYPILFDAGFALTPATRRWYGRLTGGFGTLYLYTVLGVAGLNFVFSLEPLASTFGRLLDPWTSRLGLLASLFIAAVLGLVFIAQRTAFRSLAQVADYGATTDDRFAHWLISRYFVICLVMVPAVVCGTFLLAQIGIRTAGAFAESRYTLHHSAYEAAISGFTVEPGDAAAWEDVRGGWLQLGRQIDETWTGDAQELLAVADRVFPPLIQAVTAGMWAWGLVFVLVQYLYPKRRNGAVALFLWLVMLVVSNLLPAPIANGLLGLPDGTLQGLIAALLVAGVFGIMGELWLPGGPKPGTRACLNPACPVAFQPVYGEDEIICSRCGRPLSGA